jgi:hypothetical protein
MPVTADDVGSILRPSLRLISAASAGSTADSPGDAPEYAGTFLRMCRLYVENEEDGRKGDG